MQDWVDVIERNDRYLKVKIKSKEKIDISLMERFEHDDLCLGCMLNDQSKGIMTYVTENYITLDTFLNQYRFKEEEAYLFLDDLLTNIVAANRTKPILFDANFIFVNGYGNEFRFIGIPLSTEMWILQKENCLEWVKYLIDHFKTDNAYEITGFLLEFLDAEEFSLPNLILSLKALRKRYYPKKWFQLRRNQKFCLEKPIQPKCNSLHINNTVCLCDEEKTQLIGAFEKPKAYLDKDGDIYPLVSETVLVGRSMACDVRVDSMEVSLKHAKLTCVENRWYIQDLKSSNCTFLNGKQVQRKMRLKDGMELSFASVKFIFHQ